MNQGLFIIKSERISSILTSDFSKTVQILISSGEKCTIFLIVYTFLRLESEFVFFAELKLLDIRHIK